MKKMKYLLFAIMMMGAANTVSAQDVYNIIRQKAEDIVNNPRATQFDTKVNQFKLTALTYLTRKGAKNGEMEAAVMDNQALAMNIFLTNYFKEIRNIPEKDRMEVIKKYFKAAQANPMYEDNDRATTESFVTDPGGFTPFSINVNWEKALESLELGSTK